MIRRLLERFGLVVVAKQNRRMKVFHVYAEPDRWQFAIGFWWPQRSGSGESGKVVGDG